MCSFSLHISNLIFQRDKLRNMVKKRIKNKRKILVQKQKLASLMYKAYIKDGFMTKYTSVTTQIIWKISNHTVLTLTKTITVYLHQKLKQFHTNINTIKIQICFNLHFCFFLHCDIALTQENFLDNTIMPHRQQTE